MIVTQSIARDLWVYDTETGVFTWRIPPGGGVLAGAVAGSRDSDGYTQLSYKKTRPKAHRVAWIYVYGDLDPKIEIDHLDHDRANNRISNLRLATRKQNAENMRSRTQRFRGVHWYEPTSRWAVQFKHCGVQTHLGYFKCLLDAVARRIRAEREHYTHSPFSEAP